MQEPKEGGYFWRGERYREARDFLLHIKYNYYLINHMMFYKYADG